VHALPLRLRSRVIGALNLFGADSGTLEPGDVQIVQSLGDIATIALLQERAIRHSEVLSEQLQHALTSRVAIEQAKGMLARTHDIGVDEAFDLLRGYARRHNRRLSDLAHAIVTDPTSVADLTRS
jgi:AmiR/NasT family two-component response regulator